MVKFGENGTVIVGGSNHGCVYVFNINDPEPTQVLYHEGSYHFYDKSLALPGGPLCIIPRGSKMSISFNLVVGIIFLRYFNSGLGYDIIRMSLRFL